MDDFLVGLLAAVLGAGVCFLGLRVWFFMLPIWGFVAGFFLGAAIVTGFFGDGFLSTVSGWVLGLIVGLGFALLSYLIWYVGAIIAAGSVGAVAGGGLANIFGVDSDWAIFIFAVIGGAVFALAALMLALPIYVVIASTAFAGATALVTGAMLVFNSIDLEQLEYGSAWAMIEESWFWLIAWIVVAAAGMMFQLRMVTEALLPEERWVRVQTTGLPLGGAPGAGARA
jgi:hypothetical protein